MFCPSCGSQNADEQKFCRKCGMNLEQTASSMMEQYPDGSRSDLQKQERSLEKFGNIAFGGFGVVIGLSVCGLIYLVFTRMILSGTAPVAGVLLSLFLVFAALSLAYVFRNEALKEKRKNVRSAPGLNEAGQQNTAKLLADERFEPVPSVVEDTTKRLTINREHR